MSKNNHKSSWNPHYEPNKPHPFPSSRTGDGALYLDNAATSWPKPPGVTAALHHFLDEIGANPGRSAHRASVQAARIIYETRQAVADLFNAPDPLRVVFGHNITDALNQALHGLLRPGDHVITSSMEHNSVMRPLRQLEKQGMELTCAALRRRRHAAARTLWRMPCAPTRAWSSSTTPPTCAARSSRSARWGRLPAAMACSSSSMPPRPPGLTRSTCRQTASTCWPSPGTSRCTAPPAPAGW